MIDLSTNYAGLNLKSPVIVSSSGLTNSIERIKKIAQAGAGAVVMKSLFEEQIMHEVSNLSAGSDYPEAGDYLRTYARENSLEVPPSSGEQRIGGYSRYCKYQLCEVPMNGSTLPDKIEDAGADALELNIYFLPIDKDKDPGEYEKAYLDLVSRVKEKTSLPVIVKLGMVFPILPGW